MTLKLIFSDRLHTCLYLLVIHYMGLKPTNFMIFYNSVFRGPDPWSKYLFRNILINQDRNVKTSRTFSGSNIRHNCL